MSQGPSGTSRRPDGAALIIAVVLAGFGALLIWEGFRIPDKSGYAGIGSGGIAKFIGVGMIVLALAHLVKALRGEVEDVPPQAKGPILWIVAGLALQLVLLQFVGFSIASGVLFACVAAGFGKRNMLLTLPIGIVFAFVIYGIFDQLLQLNLPGGFIETLIFGS